MAWIDYLSKEQVPAEHHLGDDDNILRIHYQNAPVARHHLNLYLGLMRGPGPLTRVQREMIGVVVSAENQCVY